METETITQAPMQDTNKPSWKNRRRFMFTVSAWIIAAISYVLYTKLNTSPAEAMVTMGLLALAGIIGSYVFGATWQDIKRK